MLKGVRRQMTSKKWLVLSGGAVLGISMLIAGAFYANEVVTQELQESVAKTGGGASGSAVSIRETSLNIAKGIGIIEGFVLKTSANTPLFEVEKVTFEYDPVSVLSGPLIIKSLDVGPYKMFVESNGKKLSTSALVSTAVAYVASAGKMPSGRKLIINKVSIAKGSTTLQMTLFGKRTLRRGTVPEIRMAALGNKTNPLSAADFAGILIKEVSRRVVKSTVK
ncbi:MAG: hypothetical protein ACJAYR_001701 [Sneathiella sp.]|jgi:hypothetical protein